MDTIVVIDEPSDNLAFCVPYTHIKILSTNDSVGITEHTNESKYVKVYHLIFIYSGCRRFLAFSREKKKG